MFAAPTKKNINDMNETNRQKLLTIIIPCYNSDWCLERCLLSLLTQPPNEKIEVIIVNDGSTDRTAEIAEAFVNKYSNIFRQINKKNGGHGSCINIAAKTAAGKYMKVLDSDDWLITENIQKYLQILEMTDADAVLTHFHTVNMANNRRQEFKTKDIELNKIYSLDQFVNLKGEIFHCTVLHGITYKTEIYIKSKTVLTENIYYEDQEFAAMPFLEVNTVYPADLFLEQYQIGNIKQSVSDINLVKRLTHIETVTKNLFRFYAKHRGMSYGKKKYIAKKATDMLLQYYAAAMIKNKSKRSGKQEAKRLRGELALIAPELIKATDTKYKLAVMLNFFRFSGSALELIKKPLPIILYRKIFKRNNKLFR